jgi:hypothetical protein
MSAPNEQDPAAAAAQPSPEFVVTGAASVHAASVDYPQGARFPAASLTPELAEHYVAEGYIAVAFPALQR